MVNVSTMYTLPLLINKVNNPFFSSNFYINLIDLQQELYDCIQGSCYVIVVNNEIVYNAYHNLSIKDMLQQEMIREHISLHPQLIIKNGYEVNLYMYLRNPYRINIKYDFGFKIFCYN